IELGGSGSRNGTQGVHESNDVSYSSDTICDTGNFECNICFELAQEPTVKLCGHLYCRSCLYQWLQIHSHSHECPVCKALVHEEKLIPIYGRGKTSYDPRSRSVTRAGIRGQAMVQQPQTAPRVDLRHIQQDELDSIPGMAATRFGDLTLSAFFGVMPAIFNLQMHGFHDATVYGSTSRVPYLFSSSFQGGYFHGFHHYESTHLEWKRIALKYFFVVIGFLILLLLIHSEKNWHIFA
ncbi:uncharacterized protein, partial [Primulina huaijiensis]|uniref:uncharacterized protein n=1 Tax=Primulina huaijiensis TaxID=1492673 RepID=UPI003CC73B18